MPNPTATALHGRGVLDIDTGEVIEPGFVRVEGNRIAEVGTDKHIADDCDEVIQLPELTLLPGLMDMEVNLFMGGPGAGLFDSVQANPAKMTLRATTAAALPTDFADLDPFADWALDTWRERYEKRLGSTMADMQAFYDAMMLRLSEILDYCDTFDLDDLPDEARNLLLLTFSLCEASFPVEAWRQPRVPDSGSADLEMVREPPL